MNLLCPKCKASKNIGDYSRFVVFHCDQCCWRFRVIHAGLIRLDCFLNYWNQFAGWSYEMGRFDKTNCPWYGGTINLGPLPYPGVSPPLCCRHCGNWLPVDYADQNDDSVL